MSINGSFAYDYDHKYDVIRKLFLPADFQRGRDHTIPEKATVGS